jgi:Uma2 family endonuclease
MASASLPEEPRTLGDLLADLGGIDPRRVLLTPAPGKATEKDLLRLNDRKRRLYELVDGVLVEKVMGLTESFLAMWLGRLLGRFLDEHDQGFLVGEAGAMRLMPGLVRIPDLAFVRWDRTPVPGQIPIDPIPDLAPDLAIEVLSAGNTRGEMERKLKEYFLAGVRLVWYVDPAQRTVTVFTSPEEARPYGEGKTVDGGAVLQGFSLPVRQIFVQLPPQPRSQPSGRGRRTRRREDR